MNEATLSSEPMAVATARTDQELFALIVGEMQRLFVRYLERQGRAYVEEGLGRFMLGEFRLQCLVEIGDQTRLTCHAIDVGGSRHSLFEIATEVSSVSPSPGHH